MKTDLITTVVAAIVGVSVGYLVCNLFFGEIEAVEINTLETSVTADLPEINSEVFNVEAINPTVEEYVGECENFDENGVCLDDFSTNAEGEATETE